MNKVGVTFLVVFNIVIAQKSNIEKIDIDTKKNGITISIYSDIKIQTSQITGWYNSSTSWSYITIYNTGANMEALNKTFIDNGITEIEIIKLNESIQLGLRTVNPIEQFEFNDSSDLIITASLRYPVNQTLAYNEKKDENSKKYTNSLRLLLKKYRTALSLLSAIIVLSLIAD